MPTYEYECTICGHHFEEFQSITAPAIEDCPECGKKVRRLIGSGAGIIFRGSGFYQTDYRSKEYKEEAEADSAKPSSSSSDSGKKQQPSADSNQP
ncbi:MAG: zinc ribbon domain-containing protein [Planctomycetes bacterium]|jgi:putative FmdB family regulatory protein|nr:zinc ribbon domain-containing protein [Planctomycetota bacterium]